MYLWFNNTQFFFIINYFVWLYQFNFPYNSVLTYAKFLYHSKNNCMKEKEKDKGK